MSNMVSALWAYRGFVGGSVKREFQAKYRNSLLGAAWTVLNPLALIIVYTVIFSLVMKARGHLQVAFSFADPVRSKDIGLGNDPRRVAMG